MTLGKVASRAGVAIDTARKVLRDDPSVRSYLRERVLEAAKELDYQPNLVARALREKNLRLVPISVLELNQPYFGALASHLSRSLVEIDLEPALCFNPEHLMRMSRTLSTSASILATGFDEETVRALSERQKVVTVDSNLPDMPGVANVAIDFTEAYETIVGVLLESGLRRVTLVSGFYHLSRQMGWLEPKFETALRCLGEAGRTGAGPDGSPVFATAREFGGWLDEHPGSADAVLCENDVTAAYVVGEMAARGLRTPEDIRVIGCDANCMLRGTWSLRLDTAWLASEAVRLLQRLLRGEASQETSFYHPAWVDDQGCEIAARSRSGRIEALAKPPVCAS